MSDSVYLRIQIWACPNLLKPTFGQVLFLNSFEVISCSLPVVEIRQFPHCCWGLSVRTGWPRKDPLRRVLPRVLQKCEGLTSLELSWARADVVEGGRGGRGSSRGDWPSALQSCSQVGLFGVRPHTLNIRFKATSSSCEDCLAQNATKRTVHWIMLSTSWFGWTLFEDKSDVFLCHHSTFHCNIIWFSFEDIIFYILFRTDRAKSWVNWRRNITNPDASIWTRYSMAFIDIWPQPNWTPVGDSGILHHHHQNTKRGKMFIPPEFHRLGESLTRKLWSCSGGSAPSVWYSVHRWPYLCCLIGLTLHS